MNELIVIKKEKINDEEVNAVNARDLHEFLEVKTRFNDWINKRINEYDFINNIDYLKISNHNYKVIDNAPINFILMLLLWCFNRFRLKNTKPYCFFGQKALL